LIVVGDLQYCLKSKVPYLEAFARYCSDLGSREDIPPKETTASVSKKYPPVDNPELVSEWEIKFYEEALFNAGIQTIPQYPVDKYILDFALFLEDGRKLDIEIDGEMYHRQWNGELCYRDQLRNQRLIELGWDVKRFWVYQIRDDTNWCIEQIKKWING
jgi:very-short-patch-repair endonuclease